MLEDFRRFCRKHRVTPHISLSGGDPLRYSHFWALYGAIAAIKDMRVSFLGNPAPVSTIKRLMSIRPPDHYQVSLEGLEEHNDSIRGTGHFRRTIRFLEAVRPLHLQTHVMLTLTRTNMSQVLALGQALRGLTSRFTFNRLAQTGNGANLELPDEEDYARFLREYLAASRENPILRLKDNLFGILLRDGLRRPFQGCTGHGCGAAFDFVALLPDGEVHACRKFPSPIGRIQTSSLDAIYRGEAARQYRAGPVSCQGCRLQARCRGCPAVVHGRRLDPLRDRDPFCFIDTHAANRDAGSRPVYSGSSQKTEKILR